MKCFIILDNFQEIHIFIDNIEVNLEMKIWQL